MEQFDFIINEGFQSNFLNNNVNILKQIKIVFYYPSISLTDAALEFAKVIPQFSESNEISLQINSNCIILSQGYQKIFEGLSQLKKLEIFKLQIGDRCLFDQDIFSYFMNASQEWQNLQELSISIFDYNILNQNSLKQIDQLKSMKNLQKLSLIVNQCSFQNEVLVQFYNGLSQLSSLKTLSINIDKQLVDDSISKQLGKTLYGLEKLENLCLNINEKLRSKSLIDVLSYLKYIPNLMSLEISTFTITNQDVYEFIKNLKQLRSLKKIYLRKVFIEYKGKLEYQKSIGQIQNILQNTMQLEVCDLSFTNIESLNDQLIQQLVSSIQHLQNLKELSLIMNITKRSNIPQDQTKTIDLSLLGLQIKHLNNLEKLNLYIIIKQEGFESLCEGIYSLENLKQLQYCIEFDEDIIEKKRFGMNIGNCLKNKNNLEQLILGYEHEICLEEAISITSSISHLINLKLLVIYLSQKINYEFIFMIFQSLTQLSRLENLSLLSKQQMRPNQQQQISNTSFSFTNLINLVTLDIWIVFENKQAEELIYLSDSFINMKNLKNLKLVLESNSRFDFQPAINLDYLAIGLANLDNLLIMSLKIDFNYNLNQIFFEKVFENMKNLIKFEFTNEKKMKKHDLSDLTNGFIYLKNLSQLHLNFQNEQQPEILDHFANMLAYLQNLSILELQYDDYDQESIQNHEKFLQQFGSLKKLNYFFGTQNLIKLIKNEINEKKIYLNNLIFIRDFNYNQDTIYYQNWQREEKYQEQSLYQTKLDKQLQLKNIQTRIDEIIIDEKMSESQITNLMMEIQKYTYLEQLQILFQTDLNTQSHISLIQHTLSSFKFLQRLGISSQTISYSNTNTEQIKMIQLSASLVNAISLSLKNLIYLEELTLKISKSNEKIKLSEGIQSLQNLKQLNLSLCNFSNEDWIDFNLFQTLIQLKQLYYLKFEIIDSQFSEKEVKDLFIGLINLKKLRILTIKIGDNSQINESGAKLIGEAINNLEQLSCLSIYIGESNNIGVNGTEFIMGLESYLNKLQFLGYYHIKINQKNKLTTQILDKLLKLKKYNISYIDIELNLNNVESIEQLYEQYDKLYQILNITQNFELKVEKKQLITTKINRYSKENNCTYIISLGFEEKSSEDCLFLLNPLKNYSNLKSLSFEISEMNLEIGQSFEKNIQLLQNLEEVKISNIDKGQTDIYILIANGLQKLVGLKNLEIKIQDLGGISEFIQKIEVLQQLKHLYFQTKTLYNQSQSQQIEIINSLSKLINLKYLFLNSTIGNQFRKIKEISCNKNLKKIQILIYFIDSYCYLKKQSYQNQIV